MSSGTTDLHALQRWMLGMLVAPASTGHADTAQRVLPGARLDASACLDIYRRSYALRLRRCLAEQFPATRHALGAALFDDFADSYLRDCPSDSATLYELGRRYADWLDANRPDRDEPIDEREGWIDFLIDLARYERELFRLFDAPGHEGAGWPDIRADDRDLMLQPCLALAQYRYPVAAYYHAVRANTAAAFPACADSCVVIARRDYRTTTYPVHGLHYRFLVGVAAHASIETALEDVAAWTGRGLSDVRRSWREDVRSAWIEAGFFVERGSVGG